MKDGLSKELLSVAHYVDESDPVAREDFHIQDVEQMDWALMRLAECEAEADRVDALVEAAIARVRARGAALKEQAMSGVRFFRGRVEEYAVAHRKELLGHGKSKTVKLLHGSVGWRKTGGDFTVNDKDALLAWAQQQPVERGFVRIKEEAAWSEIKKHAKETGEVPPGVDVEPEGEEFKVDAVAMEALNE